ncbi:MAG: type II secretion system ATPase GspE [Candidatus Omnitrophota bacterium]
MTKEVKYRLIGHVLRDEGILTQFQLDEALEEQKKVEKPLGRILIDFGYVSENDILKALGVQSGMKVVDIKNIEISADIIEKVSASTAKIYNIMPLSFEENTLTVALSEPLNINMLDDLRFMLGINVKGVIANENEIRRKVDKYYADKGESIEEVVEEINNKIPLLTDGIKERDVSSLQELASQAPVVKLLNLVLLQAIKDKASDVHFEPFEDVFKIRYRVDGVLYEITSPPKNLSLAITSRIKVMSNLDIAETRLPQDGRIMMNISGKNVDLRVSTLPTVFGESVVMRVLDRSIVGLSIDEIGLLDESKKKILEIIEKPNGIILATGPTGCGKTTTLYSCLKVINKIDYKIITTEDPVEYDISGIIQINIKPKINLTFANCLRSILRQDPDIIMVGEIRDAETAQISIQASLTGHLVLSTLHTNDAPGAITRLIDMGVEPFLITSTLEAIIAQRLIRTICSNCRREYIPDGKELAQLDLTPQDIEGRKFYYGKGCGECNNIGYKGRIGIYEVLIMNDNLRPLVIERASSAAIRKAARECGMKTLREDGLIKIYNGTTTIQEVVRETQGYG